MVPSPRGRRLRRVPAVALLTAAVALPVSGAARPAAVPAPVPAALAPLAPDSPAALDARYATTRADVRAALRAAEDHGDRRRAGSLRAMTGTGRRFLAFDGRDGGRSAEVFGTLAGARRIAVLVPGAGVDLDHYWRLRRDAEALAGSLGPRSAVVAWLGYRAPSMLSAGALTTAAADRGVPQLTSLVTELHKARPGARMSLLCHSYGSVVCARGASRLDVADIVLYGSPGTGAPDAGALHTAATVWAGRGSQDWIAHVPHVRAGLPPHTVGFGTDPVAPGFGAEVFDAGSAGHSDYLRPGSVSLRSLAAIVAGTEAGHA
ncbi:alpha/beta hydrolase family protein [Streptomyces sp. 840.1]|uniref:alpha/beta hydrolase n=1 Tax=Streptomyces sp. 840.1 TaxID=2485152 RepID=UPI000F4AF1C7|nr:alpha/beta hydrolase [Streptomyces sp. 840.1]ROQ66642.1 alpha/beta hydrolase family protein [Streptomyces sp. 840.1]